MDAIEFQRRETPGLVSIIIPTHRAERFIGATLESIGRQTYRQWEVIVVEDGEPSATRGIVAKFSRGHRWRRVDYSCNGQNRGAGATRNTAFAKAGGQYIALLDSDDRWTPDHLETKVQALQESGKDIAYSTTLMVEDGTDLVLGAWGPSAGELRDFPQSLFARSFVTPSASVLRRQVIADVGAWSTTHRYCEDFDFWLRCVQAGKTFQYVGGCHCLYRKNHAGATTQRLCGTLEEVAETTEHYMTMQAPGVREKTCRRYAAKAFSLAARFHRTANPKFDPSADKSRAAMLMLRSWRIQPKRVGNLLRGLWFGAANVVTFRSRPVQSASPFRAPLGASQPARRAA
jgi:glycosyltransferase involved in cell wall biosynthesis